MSIFVSIDFAKVIYIFFNGLEILTSPKMLTQKNFLAFF